MIQWSVFRSLRLVIRWILVQSGFDRSLIWKWICSKGTPQIRNPDPDSPKGTHPKRVLFTWIQVNSVSLEDFGFFKFIRKNVLYSVSVGITTGCGNISSLILWEHYTHERWVVGYELYWTGVDHVLKGGIHSQQIQQSQIIQSNLLCVYKP